LRDARRGRLIREGLQVAIVGPPNVGKSSLFNALVGAARAIVTDVAGTTRDLVTESVDVEGVRITLVDTAGVRDAVEPIELEGVARTRAAARVADLVVLVADRSQPLPQHDGIGSDRPVIFVANKSDLPAAWSDADFVNVSSMTGAGIDCLRRRIV